MNVLLNSVPPIPQQATTNPCLCQRLMDTQRQVWVSRPCGTAPPGSWHTRFHLCPPRVYLPVPCTFWQLYGGVNDDLLQKSLCHTQVCCTQSPFPHSRPLLTHTSTGDTQTQFCLSLCGVSGSWSPQVLFEPTEHLWQVWGLILNMISPLLPYFWGFSFALGRGVSFFGEINESSPVDETMSQSV